MHSGPGPTSLCMTFRSQSACLSALQTEAVVFTVRDKIRGSLHDNFEVASQCTFSQDCRWFLLISKTEICKMTVSPMKTLRALLSTSLARELKYLEGWSASRASSAPVSIL